MTKEEKTKRLEALSKATGLATKRIEELVEESRKLRLLRDEEDKEVRLQRR